MTAPSETARAWVDVDLDALVANARTLSAACGARLLPMVKANGYGLGAVRVALALEALDPWGYGVATVEEGMVLRQAGVRRPILVVSPLTADTLESTLVQGFRPSIGDLGTLRTWVAASEAPFHLEIDTGMSRGRVRWTDAAMLAEISQVLTAAPGWEGVFTHFHSADVGEGSIAEQWRRLQSTLAALPGRPPLVHAANSAAALHGRAYAADLIRPGIFLYGGEARPDGPAPRPVAALRARVVSVRHLAPGESVSYGAEWIADRPTTIATLAVGYADGLPRATERGASWPARTVEIRGRRVPLVGRVTMDMCMVAVDDGEVAVGDIATVFGGLITVDEHARSVGTIAYEVLTSLGPRLPRRYG